MYVFWAQNIGFWPKTVHFPSWERFFDFLFPSYGCFLKKPGGRVKNSSPSPLWGHRLPVTALALSAQRPFGINIDRIFCTLHLQSSRPSPQGKASLRWMITFPILKLQTTSPSPSPSSWTQAHLCSKAQQPQQKHPSFPPRICAERKKKDNQSYIN